jgi:hypothetical protein
MKEIPVEHQPDTPLLMPFQQPISIWRNRRNQHPIPASFPYGLC